MAQIVIIGGGVAGLAAGVRALNSGHSAVVVERHSRAGGNLTGWDREGYHIDNCIHWLTGTNPVTGQYRLWQELGALGDVPVHQGESLYTYSCDRGSLSLYRDADRLEAALYAHSHEDDREVARLMRAVRAARTVCGIAPDDNNRAATAAEVLRHAPLLAQYLPLSAGQLAGRFHSPVIRGFLRSLLSESFGALALLIVFATYCSGNGGIPSGSSTGMARRIEARFRSLGGRLMCSAEVRRIELSGGRAQSVVLTDGRSLTADYVVIACDPACAFGRILDGGYAPRRLLNRYADPRLRRFSSFHCAFACEGRNLPFTGDLIVDAPPALRSACGTEQLILREFSHEPSFAPPGMSLIQSMSFCSQVHSMRLIALSTDRVAYRAEKERLIHLTTQAIAARMPQLSGRLRCIDSWSPATYRRYTGAPTGSYLAFTLPRGRIPTMIPPRLRGLDNVLLATQWQQEPGGLPTAANAGIAAAEEINRREAKLRRPVRERACPTPAKESA